MASLLLAVSALTSPTVAATALSGLSVVSSLCFVVVGAILYVPVYVMNIRAEESAAEERLRQQRLALFRDTRLRQSSSDLLKSPLTTPPNSRASFSESSFHGQNQFAAGPGYEGASMMTLLSADLAGPQMEPKPLKNRGGQPGKRAVVLGRETVENRRRESDGSSLSRSTAHSESLGCPC